MNYSTQTTKTTLPNTNMPISLPQSTKEWKPSEADEAIFQERKPYWYQVQSEYEQYGYEVDWRQSTEPCPHCGETKKTGCVCSADTLNNIMSTSWEDDLYAWTSKNYELFDDDETDVCKEAAEMEFQDWMLDQYLKEKEAVFLKNKSNVPLM